MQISAEDRMRITAAVHDAEAATSAEIVCVLAHASSNYAYVPVVWAGLVALAVPWPLIAFTAVSVQLIYIAQLAVFAAGIVLLSVPRLRLALVPRAVRRARAHRAAAEQFLARGLTRTRDRSGVLIFVSVAERYARIIVDDGIASRVPETIWREAVDGLVAEVRRGRVAEGFVHAVRACGHVLAAQFPPRPDDVNELPDRLYVM